MKKAVNLVFVIINLIIISISIPAQTAPPPNFDSNKGYNWLVSQSRNGDYGNDIMTTAFAVMALKNVGAIDHAQQALDFIKSKEDTSKHCWPQGSCKIKDTAFALWVLNDFGEDTTGGEEYLRDSMTSALRDNWFLEVVTSNNGTCKISYTRGDNNIEKTVAVNQGKFPGCTGNFPNTFFNLNTCLESNLLNNNPSIELDINCNELGPSTIISVIYNSGSNYYIIKEATSSRDKVIIENGCFGNSAGGSCNFEATLYTNWILSTIGSDVTTFLWLRNNYDKLKTLDNALMYLIARDASREQFIIDLKPLQKNDGSFNRVIFDTAFAILALSDSGNIEEAQAAVSWLQTRQNADGSWENNLLKTALVLYAAFPDAVVSLPPPIGGEPPTGFCGDGICNAENLENNQNCPSDCPTETTEVCQVNGVCETSEGEDSFNCEQDCTCGDAICDSSESYSSCPEDCQSEEPTAFCGNGILEATEECDIDPTTETGEDSSCPGRCQADCTCAEKRGFPWWISIFIVLALIGVIIYYIKTRTSKPSEKPGLKTFMPKSPFEVPKTGYRPTPPSQPAFKSKVEDELEKSIDEAKKLLKKI